MKKYSLTERRQREKARLERAGFRIGDRDPLMNTAFTGRYMVAEPYEQGHTQSDANGGDGIWCIVGDNLGELIDYAALFFEEIRT